MNFATSQFNKLKRFKILAQEWRIATMQTNP